jgi:hypothetical protein
MRFRHIYLCLCFLGAVLPYSRLAPWLATHGFDLPLFFSELFSTRIGAFFGLDVIVSALVLFVFIAAEGRRLGIGIPWISIVATLAVRVSLACRCFCTCGSSSWMGSLRKALLTAWCNTAPKSHAELIEGE